jgi:alpha-glucuronidase
MLEQHANSQEQISACTLIWNLAFDQNVRKNYHDHKQLNQILTTIAQTSSNDELRRTASGCLCTLMGGPITKTSSTTRGNKNIMISYNHDVKQLSKQIKDHLAADGYEVWSKKRNDLEKLSYRIYFS